MILELIRYKIPEDRGAEFEEAYGKAGQSLKDSPHCLGFELSRCVKHPDRYLLLIRWDSAEGHLKGFRSSPGFQGFLALVAPFYKQLEEMEHYDKTGVEWSGPGNSSEA